MFLGNAKGYQNFGQISHACGEKVKLANCRNSAPAINLFLPLRPQAAAPASWHWFQQPLARRQPMEEDTRPELLLLEHGTTEGRPRLRDPVQIGR